MMQVFVSFARADTEAAARVAEGLRLQGLSVWWDADVSKGRPRSGGAPAALREAQLALCLWSRAAMRSATRKEEAEHAKRAGKLLPLALKNFSWSDCPESLWSVGLAVPRLQFSEDFFAWLARVVRRRIETPPAANDCDFFGVGESEESGVYIEFASKDLRQAFMGPTGKAARSPALARQLNAYFLTRPDLLAQVDHYRRRVRDMQVCEESRQIVPFPSPRVRVRQEPNIGARRVKLRFGGSRYWSEFSVPAPEQPRVQQFDTAEAAPLEQPRRTPSVANAAQWFTALLGKRRPSTLSPAMEAVRRRRQRYDAILSALEATYAAQSITDLDASMADGFAALGVNYVGVKGASRASAQPGEGSRSGLQLARWLDVRNSTALERHDAETLMRLGQFRLSEAYVTQVPGLRASVCALSETGCGYWRDYRQANPVRLLSMYYVYFGSLWHDQLAPPDIELSPRQRECLQWAAVGKSNRQIGEILDFDTEDVLNHIEDARRRLGAATHAQAIDVAIARSLIAPPYC